MTFADKLKKAMKELGISQAKLSTLTGIGKPSISQYVNGRNEPPKDKRKWIALALCLDEDYFETFLPDVEINTDEKPNVPISLAASLLHKSKEFVQESLKQGMCPFGWAVKIKNWNFCIPEPAFREFTKIRDDSNINVPVELAAKLIGKSNDFLYESMKQKVCPFGWAAELNKWDFCIPIGAFEAFTKIKVPVNKIA